jgi:hypothetical protein
LNRTKPVHFHANPNLHPVQMKLKSTLVAALLASFTHSQAATYYINNVVAGNASDVLFENQNGDLLDGGIVAIGHFNGSTPNVEDKNALVAGFTTLHSGLVGAFSIDLEGAYPGYIQVDGTPGTPGTPDPYPGSQITDTNPLIGTLVYMFVGNASTFAASTHFALASIGTFASDDPNEQQYTADPASASIVGGLGAFDTWFGGPVTAVSGNYTTLKLVAPVPEPSAALLGAIGALALLRRRRN